MIEILVILVVLLAVFIVFYRQAIEQYNILQIESTQITELPKLLLILQLFLQSVWVDGYKKTGCNLLPRETTAILDFVSMCPE